MQLVMYAVGEAVTLLLDNHSRLIPTIPPFNGVVVDLDRKGQRR